MNNLHKFYPMFLVVLGVLLIWLSGCNKDEGSDQLENELALSGSGELSVIEKDTTISLVYEFIVPAREAGEAVVTSTVDNLTYGVNYTTEPAEDGGTISIPFSQGDASISIEITVIDDDQNLPDGSVTFALSNVKGESATIGAASFKLTILDNEGESIVAASSEVTKLGEVIPGTQSNAKEVSFTSINISSAITAEASAGFVVSATAEGTYAATASLDASATSFFVKASPDISASLGVVTGTITLSVGDAETTFDVEAVVSNSVGVLFWADYFDYPINETYPTYGETGFTGAIVPVSARYRLAAAYNGSDGSVDVITGLERTGVFDTWYIQQRMAGIAMGDNALSFTGYPGSGTGRNLRLGKDGSNQRQRNDCATESKNSAIGRRFVDDGNEITSGNVYMAAMIKVVQVHPEETPVLKNAILMLTGDASFVGINAMKLNVKDDGSGGFNFGVSKSGDDGTVEYGSTSYTLGTTYAVVMKVEINEDLEGDPANDAVSVFVFKEGDDIPAIESESLVAEAVVDASNQGGDVHDVTTGLEIVFIREVADAFAAGGEANINVQDAEISGLRIATSWNALFKDASEALYDNVSADDLQTLRYGNVNCSGFHGGNLGNTDL
ncbi:hypothetical protein [Marinoscillum sp. MHG1-6]|uniref:hypothetical protein n=1 Tax=Marinoscillum sp. MHG1-6 TaxID=2959627 RepID=UPI002156FBD3|nr:hypothetical protein [Marinoscillum sp. MHG1-6]